jgi:hypothetical protein
MRLIDADKLKDVINADINRCYLLGIGSVGPLSHVLDQIDAQPTVDAAPIVHSRWKNNDGVYDTCMACGEEIYQAMEMNYCPICGAKLED